MPCNGDSEFRIIASHAEATVRTLISPDVATCDDCLREMFDPHDRRFRYPFINCTNCGPRFTITHCGPQLELLDQKGQVIATDDPVRATIAFLRGGHIAAIKGLGGFHLAADATDSAAVGRLRERKRRVGKPFAIMMADVAAAREFCEISPGEESALLSIERPIVLMRRRTGEGPRAASISEEVAPGNSHLGVFLPYTPLYHLILREAGLKAFVMTSGNLSEDPIAIANLEALRRLHTLADYFLLHNRDILLRSDDSVVRVFSSPDRQPPRPPRLGSLNRRTPKQKAEFPVGMQQLRRSRGFVPKPVFLPQEMPSILSVGGELKNTI